MVFMIQNWFVFEPGDRVYSYNLNRTGIVRDMGKLDVINKTQTVMVQFPRLSEPQEVDTSTLDLRERVTTSMFKDLRRPDND